MGRWIFALAAIGRVAAHAQEAPADPMSKLVANITGERSETPEQLQAGAWLRGDLGKDAATPNLRSSRFHLTGEGAEDTIAVFYFARANGERELKVFGEMARTIGGARRMQIYAPTQAIVLRGTQANIADAEWLLTQLDRELPLAQGQSTVPYSAANGDLLTVFYLRSDMSEALFREQTTSIRVAGAIPAAYAYWPTRVFAIRANRTQLTRVAALLGQCPLSFARFAVAARQSNRGTSRCAFFPYSPSHPYSPLRRRRTGRFACRAPQRTRTFRTLQQPL